MPGVPSGKGCDACVKQKKKVCIARIARVPRQSLTEYSVTNPSQHAHDVPVYKSPVPDQDSRGTSSSKSGLVLQVKAASDHHNPRRRAVFAHCRGRRAMKLPVLSRNLSISSKFRTSASTLSGHMEAYYARFLSDSAPTVPSMLLFWR